MGVCKQKVEVRKPDNVQRNGTLKWYRMEHHSEEGIAEWPGGSAIFDLVNGTYKYSVPLVPGYNAIKRERFTVNVPETITINFTKNQRA